MRWSCVSLSLSLSLSVSVSLSVSLLAACGGTVVEPGDVRARIATDFGAVVHATKAAYDLNAGTLPGAVLRTYLPAFPALPASERDPDATVAWLTTQLFSDAHYLGDGVYRVPAELVCATGDASCVSTWDAAQVRLRVEDDDGLRFWIQVGADRDEPIEVILRHDEVAVTADLDAGNRALLAIAPAFGISTAGASLAGAITADLAVLGPAHARATLSFDRPIAVAIAGSTLASAAATVANLELGDVFNASLALGETAYHDASSHQDLDLPGATFDATLEGGLQLTNISLGHRTTTVSVGGVIGTTLDLAPSSGRSFALAISGDRPGEAETVEQLQGHADISMSTNHTVLGDAAPTYDVAELHLGGWIALTPTELAVVDGAFSLITNPAQYSFSAATNECVAMGSAHVVATCDPLTAGGR